ncbi:hypothetical protein Pla175_08800 [Pirellulimonas nuda]|uniref:Uncharacterized protein n=1 Tax=Pirellulimonas nuda TaxID=2528009 RepID=A0A518D7R4_9BACT|nr:hypothetical protein Pla175_08800 [Pirellulimonas nuda]
MSVEGGRGCVSRINHQCMYTEARRASPLDGIDQQGAPQASPLKALIDRETTHTRGWDAWIAGKPLGRRDGEIVEQNAASRKRVKAGDSVGAILKQQVAGRDAPAFVLARLL